jgi:hypothetical protein
MRLPLSAHTCRPWRIHEIAPDFHLEDVWALPTPGGPDDLAHLVEQLADGDKGHESTPVARLLFATRWRLGALLGWDRPEAGLGARVRSLRESLPQDLLDGPRGPDLRAVPFTSVYQTRHEWTAEMANRTVHALMHIGWVSDGSGSHHAQMAVLVKSNGRLGSLYMAGIKPFRYLGVYGALLRSIGRQWEGTAHQRARG